MLLSYWLRKYFETQYRKCERVIRIIQKCFSQDIKINKIKLRENMFSKILSQPSALDLEFQYMQEQKILTFQVFTSLFTQELARTKAPEQSNATWINYFADPEYFKRRNPPKKTQATEQIEVQEESQSLIIQKDEHYHDESTNFHCNENSSNERSESNGPDEERGNTVDGRRVRRERQCQTQRRQYPTKNMLPAFRPAFLTYLGSHYEAEQFNAIPIIARIIGKRNAINMKDYQDLFCYEEFRPILQRFFEDREIYRFLMMSRINAKTKQVYLQKIQVFERAFVERNFAKIN